MSTCIPSLRLATLKMNRRPFFTVDQTIKLIRQVKKHPCIWDKEHEAFNNIFHVGTAWKTIARRLELSESVVKLKWKNLRDTFKRMVNRDPQSVTLYTGDWRFFEEMLFLVKSKKPQKPNAELDDSDSEGIIMFSINKPDNEGISEGLPYSSERYDLLFLESLAPYFKELNTVRRVAMRGIIQNMLIEEISNQNDENSSED